MKPVVKISRPGPKGLELLAVSGARGTIPGHLHASWCVVAVRQGERSLTAGEEEVTLRPGQAAVIPPGLAHGCASPVGCGYLAASIHPGLLPAWMGGLALTRLLRLRPGSSLSTVLDAAIGGDSPEAALALPELLENEIRAACPGENARAPQTRLEPSIRRVMAALDGAGEGQPGLDELSCLAGASRFHLSRRFKEATGLPPVEYRTLARLRRARALIAGGASLAEAAAACGFFDQSHLNLRFKKYMGMTPGQYARASR